MDRQDWYLLRSYYASIYRYSYLILTMTLRDKYHFTDKKTETQGVKDFARDHLINFRSGI